MSPFGSIQTASEFKYDLRFQVSDPNYHPCAYCLHGMGPCGTLRDHFSLKTASEVKSDLLFEINNLNYTCCHVYLALNCPHRTNETGWRTIVINRLACFAAGKKWHVSISLFLSPSPSLPEPRYWPTLSFSTVGPLIPCALKCSPHL